MGRKILFDSKENRIVFPKELACAKRKRTKIKTNPQIMTYVSSERKYK